MKTELINQLLSELNTLVAQDESIIGLITNNLPKVNLYDIVKELDDILIRET